MGLSSLPSPRRGAAAEIVGREVEVEENKENELELLILLASWVLNPRLEEEGESAAVAAAEGEQQDVVAAVTTWSAVY